MRSENRVQPRTWYQDICFEKPNDICQDRSHAVIFASQKLITPHESGKKKLAKTNFPFYTDFRIQTPFFPIFGSFSLFAVIWCIRCIGFSWMSGFIINIGAPKTLYTNIVASLRGDERCEHCRSNYTLGSDNGNGNGNSKGSEKLYRYLITRVCIHFGIIFHRVISIERLFNQTIWLLHRCTAALNRKTIFRL